MSTGGSKKRRLDDPGAAADQDGSTLAAEEVPPRPRPVDVGDVQLLIDERISRVEESMQRQVDALVGANAALKSHIDDIKLETEDLRRRCAVNARTIQVLKKDVKWTYSAPDIPRSHWVDQGHGGRYIAQMTEIVKKIKTITEKLRNGEKISVNLRASRVILAHDDALLPHWSELSDAIQLRGEGDLLNVSLHGIQLDRSIIEMFSQSLVSKCPFSI